jgi:3'(2'), 5'-bisphosphate nucleotidase
MEFFDDDTPIRTVIRSAGRQAKLLRQQALTVTQKGPGDFVTNVDQTLDRQLAAAFAAQFPEDGIITEENGDSRAQFHAPVPRLWCIDPIDGTGDFIAGRPDYAVMVGVLQKAQPIAGWIYAPEYDVMYYGGDSWGLWQQPGEAAGVPLKPVEPLIAANSPMILGDRDYQNFGATINKVLPDLKFAFSQGSFGLKVMNVILGQAGLYLYLNGRVKVWDTVGPLALAQAAGLVCCDLAGNPLSYAPNAMNLESLAHEQSIVVGWASYVEKLMPLIRQAIAKSGQI